METKIFYLVTRFNTIHRVELHHIGLNIISVLKHRNVKKEACIGVWKIKNLIND